VGSHFPFADVNAALEFDRARAAGMRLDIPAGTAVRLRFRVLSDVGTRLAGMDLDSLRVLLYEPSAQPSPVAVGDGAAPERFASR